MSFVKLLLTISFSIILISCGKKEEKSHDTSDTTSSSTYSFTYEYRELNLAGEVLCTTGKHTLSSADKVCSELVDHGNNNHCAENIREKTFKERCPSLVFVKDVSSKRYIRRSNQPNKTKPSENTYDNSLSYLE